MYSQLLKRIETPTEDYYNIILDHKTDIIARVKSKGQVQTAKELGMSQTTLSNQLKLLTALEDKEHRRYHLYYIGWDTGAYKIGITCDIAKRLYNFSKASSISTWALSEPTAREAEKMIKNKYKPLSFKANYDNLEEKHRHTQYYGVDFYTEVFIEDILSSSDRHYLDFLVSEKS